MASVRIIETATITKVFVISQSRDNFNSGIQLKVCKGVFTTLAFVATEVSIVATIRTKSVLIGGLPFRLKKHLGINYTLFWALWAERFGVSALCRYLSAENDDCHSKEKHNNQKMLGNYHWFDLRFRFLYLKRGLTLGIFADARRIRSAHLTP